METGKVKSVKKTYDIYDKKCEIYLLVLLQ